MPAVRHCYLPACPAFRKNTTVKFSVFVGGLYPLSVAVAKLGGVSGNGKGEQHGCSNKRFHGLALPYTTRGNLSDEIGCVFRKLVHHSKPVRVTARDKALLPGGKGFPIDEILVRRLPFTAVMHIAKPRVENQKPFSFGGGMTGSDQGEQHGCGNEGLHGDSSSL